jgi:dihydrofolate synthase / folylpolyglutamate synthase
MSAVQQLFERERFGVKLGLDAISALVEALGHPELAYTTILVGGTNGKGSVAAIVERALRATGRRTGRYTSPHLVRVEERFAIDGIPVAAEELESVAARVLDAERACLDAGTLTNPVTFFEATTATAFEIFRRAPVDVAVIEVGLGGRFDATNVVSPAACAIVSIGLDHTRELGASVSEIAFEKAGIARRDTPLILGDVPDEALDVIDDVARQRAARLVLAMEGVECQIALDEGATWLRAETPTRTYGPLALSLVGRHQVDNAIVALRLLEELDSQGFQVSVDAIETGLREVRWPGRLEYVPLEGGRALLLDAAHNVSGARALAAYVRHRWPQGLPFVFSAVADKDLAGILDALAPVATEFILTQMAHPRGAPVDALAELASSRTGARVRSVTPASAALADALANAEVVCVAGSIFLLGELLPRIETLRARQG